MLHETSDVVPRGVSSSRNHETEGVVVCATCFLPCPDLLGLSCVPREELAGQFVAYVVGACTACARQWPSSLPSILFVFACVKSGSVYQLGGDTRLCCAAERYKRTSPRRRAKADTSCVTKRSKGTPSFRTNNNCFDPDWLVWVHRVKTTLPPI